MIGTDERGTWKLEGWERGNQEIWRFFLPHYYYYYYDIIISYHIHMIYRLGGYEAYESMIGLVLIYKIRARFATQIND